MTKFSRIVVLVAGLISVFAAIAGAAGATTWSNTGDTTFTATSGPITLTSGGVSLTCSGGTLTGRAGTSFIGSVWTSAATGAVRFAPCRLGLLSTEVDCSVRFDANNVVNGFVTGSMTITAGGCAVIGTSCEISGMVAETYKNATSAAKGVLTIAGGASFTVSGSGCPLPSPTSASTIVFTITSATGGPTPNNGPIINRTP